MNKLITDLEDLKEKTIKDIKIVETNDDDFLAITTTNNEVAIFASNSQTDGCGDHDYFTIDIEDESWLNDDEKFKIGLISKEDIEKIKREKREKIKREKAWIKEQEKKRREEQELKELQYLAKKYNKNIEDKF